MDNTIKEPEVFWDEPEIKKIGEAILKFCRKKGVDDDVLLEANISFTKKGETAVYHLKFEKVNFDL